VSADQEDYERISAANAARYAAATPEERLASADALIQALLQMQSDDGATIASLRAVVERVAKLPAAFIESANRLRDRNPERANGYLNAAEQLADELGEHAAKPVKP
jgi:hypothetical protein